MAIDTTKITAFINALKAKFEQVSNKVTSWSQTPSNTNYPSEKLVKDSLDTKLDAADVPTKTSDLTNDGDGTNAFLTTHNPVDAALDSSSTNAVQNATVTTALSGKEANSNKVTSWSATVNDDHYPSEKLVKDSLDAKLDAADLPTNTSDLTNDGSDGTHPFLTEHQDLDDIEGVVTVEKQASPESGYAATYVVKQGASGSEAQVGVKINIPKDFLVRSGEVKTATSTDLATLGSGYAVGDKYIDFVINTEDASETPEHIYINVKDLVEDTTYDADNSTLELSASGVFSVKAGGITTTELDSGIVTSLGYADTFHNSPAASITTQDVNNWNAKSELTTANVESVVEEYLTAATNQLNGVSE